jgi:hypothetical protein
MRQASSPDPGEPLAAHIGIVGPLVIVGVQHDMDVVVLPGQQR